MYTYEWYALMILHAPASIMARLKDGNQLYRIVSHYWVKPWMIRKEYIRCAQISLSSMDGCSVQTLFRLGESHKVLDVGGDIVALDALGIVVSNFSCKERVFTVRLFDLYMTFRSVLLRK